MPYSVKIMPSKPIRSNRRKSRADSAQRFVAVLAYDGVSAFELGLTLEVFGLSNMGPDWYRVVVCSEHPGRPLIEAMRAHRNSRHRSSRPRDP